MKPESYTPGHTQNATGFMATRTVESHAQFFTPFIDVSNRILDAGCGPGSISIGLARLASEGQVCGVDFGASQITMALENARNAGVTNVSFEVASCYELPFDDDSFDAVFSHALMEHLAQPGDALREFCRVLKPGGVIGVCSPDFDGWLLSPSSIELTDAVSAYVGLQDANGGNLRIGKHLAGLLQDGGFTDLSTNARYECYESLEFIGRYLAIQLEAAGMSDHSTTLLKWSKSSPGMFAQSWVSAVGRKA